MLLTEKAIANVEINNLEIDLRFDFKVIENLYYALREPFICNLLNVDDNITPLDLINLLENYNESYFILILYACGNGKYSLQEIIDIIKNTDLVDKEAIYYIYKSVVIQSLVFIEDKDDKNKKDNKSNSKKENEKIDFENWFNYYYCMAIDKLKMRLEEFYKSTACAIKERVHRVNVDKKNNYISAYAEVMNAKNSKPEVVVEEATSMFDFINRI